MSTTRSRAPEFPAGLEWFNVEDPVSLAAQLGRVVLIDFGAFSSTHCQQMLHDIKTLSRRFRNNLVIISVHCPRFPAERNTVHLQKAINRFHINHAVVQDPDMLLLNQYAIKNLPTQVLVDTDGYILGAMSGDGNRSQLELIIQFQLEKTSDSRKPAFAVHRAREAPSVLLFPGRIVAASDRLYIADSGHNRILVVTASTGRLVRQFGNDAAGFIDGNGSAAAFDNPQGMVLVDDFLYVADTGNHAIRRIHVRTDDVVTVAGTGELATTGGVDEAGTPLTVGMSSPSDVAFKNGSLYIAMTGAHQIWRLSLMANTIEVFTGSGYEDLQDGPRGSAAFSQPSGLTLIGDRLFCVDSGSSAVREIDVQSGLVKTIVGVGLYEFGDVDGAVDAARFQYPLDIVADPANEMLWLADTYNNKIRRIGLGTNFVSSTNCDRPLAEPGGLALHEGTLYIANTNGHEILALNPNNGCADTVDVSEELVEI